MRRLLIVAILALCIASVGGSPVDAQVQDTCKTDTVRLNTGWNPSTNTVYGIGAPDPYWHVTCDPDPTTSEPRPAWVILKHPAWQNPLPNSQWINTYPSFNNLVNGTYCYQYCFCLRDGFQNDSIKLYMEIRADDSAAVYLNGNYLGATPVGSFSLPQTVIMTVNPTFFKVGKNCIDVRAENMGSVAAGINVMGYVVSKNAAMDKPQCCDPTSQITGMKWEDKNGDCILNGGENVLQGWTINLAGPVNTTTTTDALGNYYFTSLIPGTYTVSEVNQPGWIQTCPPGNTYTVNLAPNQVVFNKNFGNTRDTCHVDKILVNTGYDHHNLTPFPPGLPDPYWEVMCDPDPKTAEPRPAQVIVPYGTWQPPLPNTQWIGAGPNPTPENDVLGTYCFRRCFCLGDIGAQGVWLHLELRADDSATVYLNGNPIGATPNPSYNTASPTIIDITNSALFNQAGKNCLQVKVENTSGPAVGLNISGFIKTGFQQISPICCDTTGWILGFKFNDLNGNCKQDPGEPPLPGWTINVSGPVVASAVTDSTGTAYIGNLPPGTYTVTETLQPGWTQICPPGGSYTVTLTPNTIVGPLPFANHRDCVPVDTLLVSTGFDHAVNSVYPVGALDQFWSVVADPTNPSVPRPANVVAQVPPWAPAQPTSQWISVDPTNYTLKPGGVYEYRLCFCLDSNVQKPVLNLDVLADNECRVFLNGNPILSIPNPAYTTPTNVTVTDPSKFLPGKNCLTVQVRNTLQGALDPTGLDIRGWVTAVGGITPLDPKCCDTKLCFIEGFKYFDKNRNGVMDPGEVGLPGWTVQATGPTVISAVTDASGLWQMALPCPGTYKICEVPQPGWVQTAPAGGCYTITLPGAPGAVNFGNWKCDNPNGSTSDTCCTPAPSGMLAWYPLDEASGPVANDIAGPHIGQHMNTIGFGPGMKGGAYHFDPSPQASVVRVNNDPFVTIGVGSFTVDAWIKPDSFGQFCAPFNANGFSPCGDPIIDNRVWWTVFGGNNGVSFMCIDDGTGNQAKLGLVMFNNPTASTFTSTSAVIQKNQWQHVAVTVDRPTSGPMTGTLYRNGAIVGTFTPLAGNLYSTYAPGPKMDIGHGTFLNSGGCGYVNRHFDGWIDELEIFKRALTPAEVNAIYSAGSKGKCRDLCRVPELGFCKNQFTKTVLISVCNNGALPATYNWSVAGNLPGACAYDGTLLTFSPASGTVGPISPGTCVTVPVTISRPPLWPAGAVACYTFTAVNTSTGNQFTCQGLVRVSKLWCWIIPIDIVNHLDKGVTTRLAFQATNEEDPNGAIDYRLEAIDHDGKPMLVSLNGLPPGEPYLGTLRAALDHTADGSVDVSFDDWENQFEEAEIRISEADGLGGWDPVASIGIANHRFDDCNNNGKPDDQDIATGVSLDANQNGMPDECESKSDPTVCKCCIGTRGNVNGQGIIDVSDVSLLISYLTSAQRPTLPCNDAANVDGKGIVDLSDLSLLISYLTSAQRPTLPTCP